MFDGASPPLSPTPYFKQGISSYSGFGQTNNVTCFLAGTQIETPDSPRQIETPQCGNTEITLDGTDLMRRIARSSVDGLGALATVHIALGALGNPRALFVSPNHRMSLRSLKSELYFGCPEVQVPVKFLISSSNQHPA